MVHTGIPSCCPTTNWSDKLIHSCIIITLQNINLIILIATLQIVCISNIFSFFTLNRLIFWGGKFQMTFQNITIIYPRDRDIYTETPIQLEWNPFCGKEIPQGISQGISYIYFFFLLVYPNAEWNSKHKLTKGIESYFNLHHQQAIISHLITD